jgi:ankyrin repeat protein
MEISESQYLLALRLLHSLGGDPSLLSTDGSSALHCWSKTATVLPEAIELAMEKGLDITAVREDGKTALHLLASSSIFCSSENMKQSLDLLLSSETLKQDFDGNTPHLITLLKGHNMFAMTIREYLLREGKFSFVS